MGALSTNQLIARLAPVFIKHFEDRATIDLRVFPGDPERLLVFIRFFDARGHRGDLETLKAVADDAGLHIDGSGANHNSAWIEVPIQGGGAEPIKRDGVVVPFRGKRLRPL